MNLKKVTQSLAENPGKSLIAGMLFLGLTVFCHPGFAADNTGVDVAFVLDSSGSMKKNDAQRLRVQAAKMFIKLLDKSDRVAVISFSGKAYQKTGLLPLSKSSSETRLINAVDKISEKGAFTNIYDALDKGYDLLSKNKASGKKQHIILMSDGNMDVGQKDRDIDLTEKTLEDVAPALAKARIKVHTISFNDSSNIPLMRLTANDTKGTFNLIRNSTEIHEVFSSIFESVKSPDMLPINEDSFIVDDNVKEITVVVTKYKPNARTALENPEGDTITSDTSSPGVRWYKAKQFDMITLKNPSSGYWLIKFSEGGNKAYIITDLSFEAQTHSEVPVDTPFVVQAWLERNKNLIRKNTVTRSSRFFVRATHPDGKITEHPLGDDGIDGDEKSKDGYFSTKLKFSHPGQYKLDAIVMGETFDRQKSLFVDVKKGGILGPFDVRDAKEPEQVVEIDTHPPELPKVAEPAAPAPQPVIAQTVAPTPAVVDEKTAKLDQPEPENKQTSDPEATEEDSHIVEGLMIFVLVNVILLTIGGAFFMYKKYKNMVATQDQNQSKTNAPSEPGIQDQNPPPQEGAELTPDNNPDTPENEQNSGTPGDNTDDNTS